MLGVTRRRDAAVQSILLVVFIYRIALYHIRSIDTTTPTKQCCVAGSRLFVHESIYDEFVHKSVEKANKKKVRPHPSARFFTAKSIHPSICPFFHGPSKSNNAQSLN